MELFTRDGFQHSEAFRTDEKGKPYFTRQERCGRCGGAGGAEQWRFTGWTCYECGGTGKGRISVNKLYTAEQLAKLNATRDKAQARKASKAAEAAAKLEAERAAKRVQFEADNAELFNRVRAIVPSTDFAYTVLESAILRASLSDRQAEVLAKSIAEAERKATSGYIGVIGERREFTGDVTVCIVFPAQNYGWASKALYLVRVNGGLVKYMGTANLGAKGDTVTFTATISGHEEYKGEKQTLVERPKLAK